MTLSFATNEFIVSKTLTGHYLLLATVKAALPCPTYLTEDHKQMRKTLHILQEDIIRHGNAYLYPTMKPFSILADSMKNLFIMQSDETLWYDFISTNIFYDLYHCITVSLKLHDLCFTLSVVPCDNFCCSLCSCSWTSGLPLCLESHSYRGICLSCLVGLCCLSTYLYLLQPAQHHGGGQTWRGLVPEGHGGTFSSVEPPGLCSYRKHCSADSSHTMMSSGTPFRWTYSHKQLVQRLWCGVHAGPTMPLPADLSFLHVGELLKSSTYPKPFP